MPNQAQSTHCLQQEFQLQYEKFETMDENANNIQHNATTNWTEFGRELAPDISSVVDIQNSIIGEMTWDITPLAQQVRPRSTLHFLLFYADKLNPVI